MHYDRRDDPWERIAARLDEALSDARMLAGAAPQSRPARQAAKLLDYLTEARREVSAREVDARVAAARALQLEGQLDHIKRRANALIFVSRAINAVRDLRELLQLLVSLAVDVTRTERGLVVIPGLAGEPKEFTAAANLKPQLVTTPEFAVSRSVIEHVLREGKTIATTDAQNDPELYAGPSVRALHIRSIICAPIRSRDAVVGAIYVDSRIGAETLASHDPELLTAIADQAAMAIDNARLYEDLSRSFSELSALKSQTDEILESIASGVIVLDHRDVVRQFNRAAETTFGLSASTIVGRAAHLLNTWLPGFSTQLDQHRAHPDRRLTVDMIGAHVTRGRIDLQVTFFPIRSHGGEPGGTAIAVNDVTERRARETERLAQTEKSLEVARSFERYLAPHVVQDLLTRPEAVALGGSRLVATMLFADIRGFTELSARLDPEEVVDLLNRYLEPMVNVIFANSGLLDKFFGDGVMAVFGAPRPSEDDARRAVDAARQILEQAQRITVEPRISWPLAVSVGLATGDVVAGHIGSERRLEYTVIGDAVNLAARLQAIAEPNQIVADERTYELVKGRVAATRRMARIKGQARLMTVYVLH